MEFTQFGSTNLHVSKICFGTWAFGGEWGNQDRLANQAAIRAALDIGINFFDTAQAYGFGLSESFLSESLRPEIHTKRDKLVLVTKGGLRQTGDQLVRDSSRSYLRQGLESSLRALDTDYIDLYLIHWPDPMIPMSEVAATLDEFVKEGKVRFVGGSNLTEYQIESFAQVRPLDGVQSPYHLFRRKIETGILPYCHEHQIGVQAYGPLAHGLLTGRFSPTTTFPANDWRSKSDIFKRRPFKRNLEIVEQLKQVARQRGCSLPQLATALVLAHTDVDSAIVGTLSPYEVVDIAGAVNIHLTAEEMQMIGLVVRSSFAVGGPSPEGTFTTDAQSQVMKMPTGNTSTDAPI
jgi:aryl-alcohol dehydrogenase-like predicted oxidoreductase